jgi:phosphoesterase RecJ-like protein
MDPIIQRIKAADRILVASHAEPDGDAVGSLLALGLALEKIGKRTTLYNASVIPAVYQFLPGVARITRRMPAADGCDAAIILDCGDLSRIGPDWPEAAKIPVIINIDHHITNTRFGHAQVIDGDACATAEIVHRLIPLLGVEFDRDIATAVYTGILTDTGSFRFSNTNAAAFAIGHAMTKRGVDPYHVAQHVFGSYSLGRIKLLNLALNSIEISPNGKLSIMTITRGMLAETGTQPEDVDGLINYARRIEAVRVAALIQEQGEADATGGGRSRFHVSLRSDGTVDVAAWAGSFGGGGHLSAAGFQVESTLEQIKAQMTGWSVGM